jgi:hypothetical protein
MPYTSIIPSNSNIMNDFTIKDLIKNSLDIFINNKFLIIFFIYNISLTFFIIGKWFIIKKNKIFRIFYTLAVAPYIILFFRMANKKEVILKKEAAGILRDLNTGHGGSSLDILD